MSNMPVPGKQYTDRDGYVVTVISVEPSRVGNVYSLKKHHRTIGYTVTMSNGKFECTIGLQAFNQRGFKCTSP